MLEPTVSYERFDDKVEVRAYGKITGELDESRIARIASKLGVKHIYYPQTHAFNTKICRPADFAEKVKIDGVKIHFGCLADGVVLDSPEEAVCLRTADCPTIVTRQDVTGEVIAAHAGRASLIDQDRLKTGRPSREPESVTQRICERLIDFGRQTLIFLEVYSCCGIGPTDFRHPIDHSSYGLFNQRMNHHIALHYGTDCFLNGKTTCGALDLHRLIRNQFAFCGVPRDNIHHDQVDTARDRNRWWSRRGGDKTGHNTILVIRRS